MDDVGDVVELEVGDVVGDEGDTDVGVLVDDDEGVEVWVVVTVVPPDDGGGVGITFDVCVLIHPYDPGGRGPDVSAPWLCELVDDRELVEDDEGVELLCELALSIVLIALLRNRV